MGSYLLFTGILLSAKLVARDRELRKEFHNTAISQLGLLKTIGVGEMEKQFMERYKTVDKVARSLENIFDKDDTKHGLVDEMDRENVREILHDVLTELYSKRDKI